MPDPTNACHFCRLCFLFTFRWIIEATHHPEQIYVELDSLENIALKRTLPNITVSVHLSIHERLLTILLSQPHQQLYASLGTHGVAFKVDSEYNTPGIFVGAAMTFDVSYVHLAMIL